MPKRDVIELDASSDTVTVQDNEEAAPDPRPLKRKLDDFLKDEHERNVASNCERILSRGVHSRLKDAPDHIKEEVLKNWTQSRRHINRQAALLAQRYCARTDAIKDQSEAFQTILENVEGDYNRRFTNQGKSLGPKELFEFIRKGTKAHLLSHGRRGAERKTDAEVNEYLTRMFTDGVAGGRAD